MRGKGLEMAAFKYEDLKNIYGSFEQPVAVLRINDKDFADNKDSLVLNDIEVELTCGFEASTAVFCIYNVFEEGAGYRFEAFKSYVQLGSKTDLSLGYHGQARQVFSGVITAVEFLHKEKEIPYIQVTAMDLKGIMMSCSFARQLQAKSYSEAVREVFSRTAYSKLEQYELLKLEIDDTPDKEGKGSQQDSMDTCIEMLYESDYEFVVRAAKRYHYEFFILCNDVYFRKAKKDTEVLISLAPKKGLLDFDITYDITSLTLEAEVRGFEPGKGELLSSSQKINEKFSEGSYAKAILKGSAKVQVDSSVTTADEAKYRAKALAESITDRFGRLNCTCQGIPELIPGRYVQLAQIGKPAENIFYVRTVRHVLNDSQGFQTILTGTTGALDYKPA